MKLHAACVVFVLLSLAQLTFAQTIAETAPVTNNTVAQSGDAPTLSGGGTKGYVPLWLSSGKLGNSKLFQIAGEIGIGTTTPTATLDVNGPINAATSYNLGKNLFAFGSYANENGFLGFAGNSTMTGMGNTASGYGALSADRQGSDNTVIGAQGLLLNTTGFDNTASGFAAMSANTDGYYNTAIGSQAMYLNTGGVNNTATGFQALYLNTTGDNNTAIGWGSLQTGVGSNNTAIGFEALGGAPRYYNGSNNTAVGYQAGGNITTGGNNIEIGTLGTSGDNGAIRIGTTGTQTSAFIAGIYGVPTSVNNAVPVLIDSNGNLGTISSSRRYKDDIQDMGDASSGLMQLRPVTFRYKKPFADGSQPMQYGLIAEEVAEVYPELVARSADGQIETVKYQLLDPMLLNEVQRQQAEIRDLQERLSKMEMALGTVSHAPESR